MKNFLIVPLALASHSGFAHSFSSPSSLSSPFLSRRVISTIPRGGSDSTASSIGTDSQRRSTKLLASTPDMIDLVLSNLKSGPFGPLSLTAIIASVVVPLSLYKQAFSFSVGYGASVFAAAVVIFQQFALSPSTEIGSLLAMATMFYGARLSTFLLIRNQTMKSSYKDGDIKSKLMLALSVSPFYAFLTTPLLVAARVPIETSASAIGAFGLGLAWFGAILEAVADLQKYLAKRDNAEVDDRFVGPTSGAYLISRHPNYLGEILFWAGSLIAAVPSLGTGVSDWICSLLGIAGIFSIMTNATKRLEEKQAEKYKGQPLYEEWTNKVEAPLFPFVK